MNRKSHKKRQKKQAKILNAKQKALSSKLVRDFLSENKESTNLELAHNLKLSFDQLSGIAIKHNITEFIEDGLLTKAEKEILNDFLTSRLGALNKQKKGIGKDTKLDNRKLKAFYKRAKSKGGAGVYDKIRANGGIGKLIYNAMRK